MARRILNGKCHVVKIAFFFLSPPRTPRSTSSRATEPTGKSGTQGAFHVDPIHAVAKSPTPSVISLPVSEGTRARVGSLVRSIRTAVPLNSRTPENLLDKWSGSHQFSTAYERIRGHGNSHRVAHCNRNRFCATAASPGSSRCRASRVAESPRPLESPRGAGRRGRGLRWGLLIDRRPPTA